MKVILRAGETEISFPIEALSENCLYRDMIFFAGQMLSADDAAKATPNKPWNLILVDVGPNKIEVIKKIRSVAQLGLKEAKEATERGRTIICTLPNAEEAAKAMSPFRSVGASVEIEEAK